MTIEDLEELMDKFYDINKDVDQQVFDALNSYFENNKNGFIDYINSRPFGPDSYRAILYESIMDDANGWEDFLYEQIMQIVDASDSGNKDAEYELSSLYYLTNISDLQSSFYSKSIEYLRTKLNSNYKEVRKAALEYILDLNYESKARLDLGLKELLQKQLYDKSYNVRLFAYLHLTDFKLIPKRFKRTLIDKIRTRMSSSYRGHLKAKKIGQAVAKKIMKNEL